MRQFARPLMVLALLCLGITGSRAQGTPAVFINEIHYDNTGADSGEFIEIAGPAGTNLAGYSLVLYNGAVAGAAVTYNTKALAGVIPNQLNGYGTISFAYPADGIQNGGNDAVALAQGASVLQFLSYEGVTTASNGPAAGMTSADIGVSENGTGAIGTSLRLTGAGSGYSDFVWAPTAAASPGLVNQGQTFGAPPDSAPAVIGTSPASGALNVPVDSTIAITFSESVNATPDAFAVSCGGPIAVSQTASPAATISLKPNSDLPFSTHCTVTVLAAKISDQDANDPPDQMAANYTFSFDTISAADDAPSVASVSPADGTTAVPVSSNIVVTFSEVVTATVHAFTVDCAGPRTFSQTGSASDSFTIDPDVDLPYGTVCTVAINAAEIFDADTNDPPDSMAANMTFSFTTADPPPPVATNVMINELDSDQAGVDAGEFVELFDGGAGATPLDGLTLVLYNGSNDLSYAAFDLDGKKTDANGYFILGNAGVPGVGLVFPGNFLQNGQDAVALFVGNATDFPNGTAVTTLNLQDAVVYDKGEADDPGLLALLNPGEPQVNEAGGGNGTGDSIGRCPDGSGGQRNTSTYRAGAPSAGAVNVCPPPPPPPATSVIVISQIYGGGGSVDAAYQNDYVELYNRGTVTVDTTGWSLQYAAATGSGWDFNKTPLGGPIAPGEYYLVRLASNGANGAALPAANVSGPINMSASQGKIAIVDSFDALVGNCPIANPHLKDLVGYGGADCAEGAVTAPSPGVPNALLRLGNGATDTDINGADFATGGANPRRTAPIVELGPVVLTTDPSANNSNVPRDPTIVISFTEPVHVTDPWFDITCNVTGQHNTYTLAGGGRVFDITPNVTLLAGETCTVTIFKDQVHDQDLDDAAPNTDTLLANYSWSFLVANGTAPPYSPGVHLTMGNPSDATTDIGHPENYLMEKPEYTLSYNSGLGRPNWVSWHLSPEWYGTLTRVDTFRADPQVPPDWYRVQGFDFSGSGFDRGHMVPNADRDKETSIPINQATYLMTNMIAQAPGNNQGPWAALENELRSIADASNELYVISGPEGIGGTGSQGGVTTTIAGGHVTVPSNTWKVALVLPRMNGDDVARATCTTRTIAVIMPNVDNIRDTNWRDYLTSVDAVEALTGFDFFENLPDDVEYCVEAGIDGNNPPADIEPPVIQCGAPDGAWHEGNVSIACTATDAGSGLSHATDASFVLTTSVAPGGEDANAATGSRLVCDALGNCATAGPIAGNKIDRLSPGITLTTPVNGAVYQLNHVVNAAFSCADSAAGVMSCVGTAANGTAIDTASAGTKNFTVTSTDAVGNSSTTTVSYVVAPGTIAISNIPVEGYKGESFVPAFAYAGNGVTSVTSVTPSKCSVSGNVVSFLTTGTCTLVARASATTTFDAATGAAQSFTITRRTPAISIANIPTLAVKGGSFTPLFVYDGDGTTHLDSQTPSVCKVHGDTSVRFVGAGTCTVSAWATPSGSYQRADGPLQSFVVR